MRITEAQLEPPVPNTNNCDWGGRWSPGGLSSSLSQHILACPISNHLLASVRVLGSLPSIVFLFSSVPPLSGRSLSRHLRLACSKPSLKALEAGSRALSNHPFSLTLEHTLLEPPTMT
eukprot:3496852-Rhodomonas_salina.1